MGMYYVKVYDLNDGGVMVAIADEEAVGRVAVDDERGVAIMVPEHFYAGRLVREEEVIEIMEKADVLVLAGDRVIGLAQRMGLVDPSSVLRVGNLSHAQVFKFGF